ncbi:hypothetical protein GUJ93_ZPchr0014g46969 [Zizania palustris]|uniref:HMA domain-containing protein n=1 Tax=Zizania palustris TaxID=103762 RepID=A0A8J5W5R0_ZIZPA|nr:hypothetical protein GUJ93_ZPchr0014g46969 [Zizania palustris]
MKQKIVIKVCMRGDKMRSRAMELVAGAPGVISVAVIGDDKDRLEVKGDGVDSVCLVRCLRKKIGYACIVQVEVEVEKAKKDDDPKPTPAAGCQVCQLIVCRCHHRTPPFIGIYDETTTICSIM